MNEIEVKYKHRGVLYYPSIAFPRNVIIEIVNECRDRRIALHAIEAFVLYDPSLGIQPSMDYSIDFPPELPLRRGSYSLDEGYDDALRILSQHPEGLMYEICVDLPDIPIRLNRFVIDRVHADLAKRMQRIASNGVIVEARTEDSQVGVRCWVVTFRKETNKSMANTRLALYERLLFERPTIEYTDNNAENHRINFNQTTRKRCEEIAEMLTLAETCDEDSAKNRTPILKESPLALLYRVFDLMRWCEVRSIYL